MNTAIIPLNHSDAAMAIAGRNANIGQIYGMNSIIQEISASERYSFIFIQNILKRSNPISVRKNIAIQSIICHLSQLERAFIILSSFDKMNFE
jgi:hypothetical protein